MRLAARLYVVALALSFAAGCRVRRARSPEESKAIAALEHASIAGCTGLVRGPTRVQIYAAFGKDGLVEEIDIGRDTDASLAWCLKWHLKSAVGTDGGVAVAFNFEPVVVPGALSLDGSMAAPASSRDLGGGPSFDRGAAAASLGSADVSTCGHGAHTKGHVSVVFEASGAAIRARVDAGDLSDAAKRCVQEAFLRCRVPPFAGGEVSVGKMFSF